MTSPPTSTPDTGLRSRVAAIVESSLANSVLTWLIVLNAASIAFQTYGPAVSELSARLGINLDHWFNVFDHVVILVFTVEVAARIWLHGRAFFRDGWNIFDAVVVLTSLVGQSPIFSVLRILRVLRLLRLLKQIESLRLISSIIVKSTTGCLSISFLMLVVLFIFALAGHALYGASNPELFGELHVGMYTLFRVASFYSLEDVAAALVKQHPSVYVFLIPYFVIMSYIIINFFSAIVVYYLYEMSFEEVKKGKFAEEAAAQEAAAEEDTRAHEAGAALAAANSEQYQALMSELGRLRQEVRELQST